MQACNAKETMLVVSTAHIEQTTAEWLDEQVKYGGSSNGLIVFPKREYGWFIYVNLDQEFCLDEIEISEDLRKVLKLTAEEGCCWLCLDREGYEIDNLHSMNGS